MVDKKKNKPSSTAVIKKLRAIIKSLKDYSSNSYEIHNSRRNELYEINKIIQKNYYKIEYRAKNRESGFPVSDEIIIEAYSINHAIVLIQSRYNIYPGTVELLDVTNLGK